MSVISISIEESSEQLIAGIPRTISLSTNIPSTIFYTLDGTTPDVSSSIYVVPIRLPTEGSVKLQLLATNGIDNSPIITKEYNTSILNNSRRSHSLIGGIVNSISGFPYGSSTQFDSIQYLSSDTDPSVVNNPALPVIPFGFDASGNPAGGTNLPLMDYYLFPPETDAQNRPLPGVIPGNRVVVGRDYPDEYSQKESSRSDRLFNPKSMVIFQDTQTEDQGRPPMINRGYFSTENLEVIDGGGKLQKTSGDSSTITGSYIRSCYNPRTCVMTDYYRDSSTNKWIISSYPYVHKDNQPNVLPYVSPIGPRTVGKIFQHHLWMRRFLT